MKTTEQKVIFGNTIVNTISSSVFTTKRTNRNWILKLCLMDDDEYHLSQSDILKSGKEKMYSGERFRCNDKDGAVKRYESFLSTYKNFSTITLN